MAIKTCRECGQQVSTEAETCPHCGVDDPYRGKHRRKIVLGWIVIAVAAFGIYRFANSDFAARLFASPRCEIVSQNVNEDMVLTDGEPDFAYRVDLSVKNVGDPGPMPITVVLSTSEGEFQRTQTLVFDADQVLDLTYRFHEPTINATSIQAQTHCGG